MFDVYRTKYRQEDRPMNPHLIRLAETRAKARGLRGVNVDVTAFEELGTEHDAPRPVQRARERGV